MRKYAVVAVGIGLAVGNVGCVSTAYRGRLGPVAAARTAVSPFTRQVVNAVDAGDGDWNVRQWQRHLIHHPEDVEARRQLAGYLERIGQGELAAEHRRLAAEQRPGDEELWIEWATTLRALGWRREAEVVLTRASTRSASAALFSLLGIVRDQLGEHAAAEAAHRQALANSAAPDSALLNNLGFNLLLQRRTKEAIRLFREALALRPRSPEARGNLARALAMEGTPEALAEALIHWKSVASVATAHSNLAAALLEQGRHAEARRELETALAADPAHRAALENLALVAQVDGGAAGSPRAVRSSPWKWLQMAMRPWFHSDAGQAVAPARAAR